MTNDQTLANTFSIRDWQNPTVGQFDAFVTSRVVRRLRMFECPSESDRMSTLTNCEDIEIDDVMEVIATLVGHLRRTETCLYGVNYLNNSDHLWDQRH